MANSSKNALAIFKSFIFLTSSIGLLSSVDANEITENLKKCAEIKSDNERLSCLDELIASLPNDEKIFINRDERVQENEKNSSSSKTLSAAKGSGADEQNSITAEALFGIENKEKKIVVEKIYATVVKVIESRLRDTKYHLDNGQVWAKKDSSRLKIRNGDKVYIERGALTSFYMGTDGQNTRTRVARLE